MSTLFRDIEAGDILIINTVKPNPFTHDESGKPVTVNTIVAPAPGPVVVSVDKVGLPGFPDRIRIKIECSPEHRVNHVRPQAFGECKEKRP